MQVYTANKMPGFSKSCYASVLLPLLVTLPRVIKTVIHVYPFVVQYELFFLTVINCRPSSGKKLMAHKLITNLIVCKGYLAKRKLLASNSQLQFFLHMTTSHATMQSSDYIFFKTLVGHQLEWIKVERKYKNNSPSSRQPVTLHDRSTAHMHAIVIVIQMNENISH